MDLLFPVKWVIELILVGFHSLFGFFGLTPESGITWVLSIVGLVLVVRSALIPLFVKQIRSQRNMQLIQPQMKAIQTKYAGDKQKQSEEIIKFAQKYKNSGTFLDYGAGIGNLVESASNFGFDAFGFDQHRDAIFEFCFG
jgi:YidC/Oxa1 family membrane protein insertase